MTAAPVEELDRAGVRGTDRVHRPGGTLLVLDRGGDAVAPSGAPTAPSESPQRRRIATAPSGSQATLDNTDSTGYLTAAKPKFETNYQTDS